MCSFLMRAHSIRDLLEVGEIGVGLRENMIPMSSLITALQIMESLPCIKDINRAIINRIEGTMGVAILLWWKRTTNMATREM
jgi:hypothetical protein